MPPHDPAARSEIAGLRRRRSEQAALSGVRARNSTAADTSAWLTCLRRKAEVTWIFRWLLALGITLACMYIVIAVEAERDVIAHTLSRHTPHGSTDMRHRLPGSHAMSRAERDAAFGRVAFWGAAGGALTPTAAVASVARVGDVIFDDSQHAAVATAVVRIGSTAAAAPSPASPVAAAKHTPVGTNAVFLLAAIFPDRPDTVAIYSATQGAPGATLRPTRLLAARMPSIVTAPGVPGGNNGTTTAAPLAVDPTGPLDAACIPDPAALGLAFTSVEHAGAATGGALSRPGQVTLTVHGLRALTNTDVAHNDPAAPGGEAVALDVSLALVGAATAGGVFERGAADVAVDAGAWGLRVVPVRPPSHIRGHHHPDASVGGRFAVAGDVRVVRRQGGPAGGGVVYDTASTCRRIEILAQEAGAILLRCWPRVARSVDPATTAAATVMFADADANAADATPYPVVVPSLAPTSLAAHASLTSGRLIRANDGAWCWVGIRGAGSHGETGVELTVYGLAAPYAVSNVYHADVGPVAFSGVGVVEVRARGRAGGPLAPQLYAVSATTPPQLYEFSFAGAHRFAGLLVDGDLAPPRACLPAQLQVPSGTTMYHTTRSPYPSTSLPAYGVVDPITTYHIGRLCVEDPV